MPTLKELRNEIMLAFHGYGLTQPRTAMLTQAISASGGATFTMSAPDLADAGLAECEDELMYVSSVDRDSGSATVDATGRGYYGTSAAAHAEGVEITFAPTWPKARINTAINNTILNTYPQLFGVQQHQFTFNPSVTTYSLPAEAERILAVSADMNGPSMEQQQIRRYALSSVAPTDDWVTTNTITLQEPVTPGRTVTVTYSCQPSELSADTDELTSSGLRNTASRAIVYGAAAELLAFMDVARLPLDTVMADEMDEQNQIGSATRIANQLQIRAEMELEREAKRLRATTPVPMFRRTR